MPWSIRLRRCCQHAPLPCFSMRVLLQVVLPSLLLAPVGLSQTAVQTSADSAPAETKAAPATPTGEMPAIPDSRAAIFWADWSGDGLEDAWAVQPDGSGKLLENLGDGDFADRTAAAGLEGVSGAHQAAWADVDGDGTLDLYLASVVGESRLFMQVGKGDFIDVTPTSSLSPHARPLDARWLDYDGDGLVDLHLTTRFQDVLYRGVGRARFEEVELGILPRGGQVVRPRGAGGAGAARTISGVTPLPPATQVAGTGICAATIVDQASGICIEASSTPMLGKLYPISSDLFVDSTSGHVGIGTVSTPARLTVDGDVRTRQIRIITPSSVAPLVVDSAAKVDNLNADLLDGLDSSQFLTISSGLNGANLANGSVSGAKIADGTLFDADISGSAAIAGSKVVPSFGAQQIQGSSGGSLEVPFSLGNTAMRGAMPTLDLYGHLGVATTDDFEGVLSADLNGLDIGALGISVGASSNDNVGVLGHSNFVGVRGEHSVSPDTNYGELGKAGVGVYGRGDVAAGRFDGAVEVTSTQVTALDVQGGGASFGEWAATISNPTGGPILHLEQGSQPSTFGGTAVDIDTQNEGTVLSLDQQNPNADLPALSIRSAATNNTQGTLQVVAEGAGVASGVRVLMRPNMVGPAVNVVHSGTGIGLRALTEEGVGLELNKSVNSGNIITASNGTDLEFRVDSTGDVFCDGAFTGGGADYAEWLPKLDPAERLRTGDVVGVHSGRISRDLEGAHALLVISTDPCLVGNSAGAEADSREAHEIVAFMGQVPVRVRGAVRRGDLLVPSGSNDGVAVAVAPEDLDPRQVDRVIGRAWESARGAGEHRVNASIGLGRAAVTAIAFEAVRAELDQMRDLMEGIAARVEALEASR